MIDDSREGLSGLDEALCVRHIANSPLITCQRADDFSAVFGRSEYKDFDQLPVCEAERIVGIVERSNPKSCGFLQRREKVCALLPRLLL